ncbi:hypothetical protein O6H91_Y510800 [Diphasiastrum complanatum]|nr:hypothetical protein O6H91_Y510800 [Diphasiastrum complanatum]
MEVANLANPSLAFFVDSRAQCCSKVSSLADSSQLSDVVVCRGRRNKSCLILPGTERIRKVGLKRVSKRSIESGIDQAGYSPSSLSSTKAVLDARPCIMNGVSDSFSSHSKRKGSIFTKSMKKHFKSGCKWSKDRAEHVLVAAQVNLEPKRSLVPEEFFFQKQIENSCVDVVEFQFTHSSDTFAFEVEASENNGRKRRTGSNSQNKMGWQACATSAFAAGCAALGIRKLQSVFVETIPGGSTNLGFGDGGGVGNSGGWGQGGGGGMEDGGSNVGRPSGVISEKDDDVEEVSPTTHCEELENVKDARGNKMPALASLSSATRAYRLNADLTAGGETVVDNRTDKTMGQTSLGTCEQLFRLATEAPQKSIVHPQGVEHPIVRNTEEFGDNLRRKNSNSQVFPEGNAQWFEGQAHVHLTRIGVGLGFQNNEDDTPRLNSSAFLQQIASNSTVVSSNNKETFVESNLPSSGTTKSEGHLNLESSANRGVCDGILPPLSENSARTSDVLHDGRSFNVHEKSESGLQSEQSDMKIVPSNPNKMDKRTQLAASKVARHVGEFDPQAGSTQSDKINQEGPLGRIANLVHSAVAKRTGGQGTSHRNAQELEDHERKHLVTEAVALVLQQLSERTGDEAFARRSEIGALKRLQREVFSDLLKIRERLDKLEHHAGLRQIKSLGDPLGVARTRLKGLVNVGAAFCFSTGQK